MLTKKIRTFLRLIQKHILTNVFVKDCDTERTAFGDNSLIRNFIRSLRTCACGCGVLFALGNPKVAILN